MKRHTVNDIFRICEKFKIGDTVNIVKATQDGNNKTIKSKTPGIVVKRYPHHLIVEKENGIQESFTYKDIVLLRVVEHKQGRPRKVS